MEISEEAANALRGVMQSYLAAYGYEFDETLKRDKGLERAWKELRPKATKTESWISKNCKFALTSS